jgi:hypothetical protein
MKGAYTLNITLNPTTVKRKEGVKEERKGL